MTTVLVDSDSGNLHSAEKAFQRMAAQVGAGRVEVTADPDRVARAERVVLPGDGAFPACLAGLRAIDGMEAALQEAALARAVPFLGICIGMQLLATRGLEHGTTAGFGWIPGEVVPIAPGDPARKVPHMGWNDVVVDRRHPALGSLATGDHAYFVHSYQFRADHPEHVLAHVDYGGPVTAIVGRDNILGLQFHPEKSQTVGLALIAAFLTWRP